MLVGAIRDAMRTIWVVQVCLVLGVGLSVGRAADARAFEPPLRAAPAEPAPNATRAPGGSPFGVFATQAERDAKLESRLSLYIRERALDAVFNDVAQIAGLRMRSSGSARAPAASRRLTSGALPA